LATDMLAGKSRAL